MYKNNKSENIKIKTIASSGFSFLDLSYFRTFLTLKLVPWLRTNNRGIDEYCRETYLSTTLDHNGAVYFYKAAMFIIDGEEGEVSAVLPCKNGATVTLEYKPDENNQMTAYLIIDKNNITIPFRFKTQQTQKFVDGQWVTKIIHVDLEAFAMILDDYLKRLVALNTF